jgi:hypothetical protein
MERLMQPIGQSVRYAFDGKPKTWKETDDNGNVAFRVIARVLTPARAKLADKLGETTAAAGVLLSGLYIINHDLPPTGLLFAGALWFLHPLFEKAWREAIKRKVEMVVTADQFRFRRWLRWIAIDRTLPHGLSLRMHDLAHREHDQHQLEVLKAQQRKKIVQPRRYYQESRHLCYELLGQRNDITEIYGLPDAQAVLARLRAIDGVINASARRGDGTAIRPGDQWLKQPGEIPEKDDR